jgi:hypothetical protein
MPTPPGHGHASARTICAYEPFQCYHKPGLDRRKIRRLARPFSKSAKDDAQSAPGVGLALSRGLAPAVQVIQTKPAVTVIETPASVVTETKVIEKP